MDGRLVLLGLIVVITVVVARDMKPTASAEQLARERAAAFVLVEVDRTQQCYLRRRQRYARSIPSLLFAGGHFMRTALRHRFDIRVRATADGYVQRVTGEGIEAMLERRGTDVVRVEAPGDPELAAGC